MQDKSWANIYWNQIKNNKEKYFKNKIKEKKKLINKILKNTSKEDKILEIGCGTAIISIYLAKKGYNVTAIDKDQNVLRISRAISKKDNKKPSFICKDIKKLNFPRDRFDISFSSGVLEHFSDRDITKILKLQGKSCKKVIFVVPSKFFKEKEKIYGDERFLSFNKWRDLIDNSGLVIIEEFQFFYYDPSLFKRFNIKWRSLIRGVRPYIGFVLENKNSK